MKDQYFGDVNDFRKYGLLRYLNPGGRLRVGICWMLTESDGKSDGKFLAYLDQPTAHRGRDPELFDWLRGVVRIEQDRRIARIEATQLLGSALFHSRILVDCINERNRYVAEYTARFAYCDLVFFDPDNGLQIKTTAFGRENSFKFLFWDELIRAFAAGSSVLVYQVTLTLGPPTDSDIRPSSRIDSSC